MSPCVQIIKRIENKVETLEEFDVELGVLDIGMMRFELHLRVKLFRAFFRNLNVKN